MHVPGHDPMALQFGQNFRNGPLGFQLLLGQCGNWRAQYFHCEPRPAKRSTAKDKNALQIGFGFIKEEGPRTNMYNRQTEWTEMEIHREGSPIFGWSSGLVKESLRGYSSSNVFVVPTTNFFLTLHDLNAWFLRDILAPLLKDIKTKTLVFMGLAEKGKTPAAQAIAMAISEYYILKEGNGEDEVPSFRLCSSLDQLRGEPGVNPTPKLKAFLDSSLMESHTVERWTTNKFILHQLRIIYDNKVNEAAEPEVSNLGQEIPFGSFLDMIAPAFPEKASKQDMLALLKRAHWVVNMPRATNVRKAGGGEGPVRAVPYDHGVMDFISEEGKHVIRAMKEGNPLPPNDWLMKRQWSHGFLSMIIDAGRVPSATAVIRGRGLFDDVPNCREVKPASPPSGRHCLLHRSFESKPSSSNTSTIRAADPLPRVAVKKERFDEEKQTAFKKAKTWSVELNASKTCIDLTDDADEPAEFDQEDFEKGLEAALEENLDMDVDEDYLEHGAGLESPDACV